MKKLKTKYGGGLMLILIPLILLHPGVLRGADIPSAEDVAFGKAECPTIEELTGGKVKIGDVIDKNNVDLIKDYLCEGAIETVNQGLKIVIGKQFPPFKSAPPIYREMTEKNRGKAVLDEGGLIMVFQEKQGQLWTGGCPFPEPKNAREIMGNYKFGFPVDDYVLRGWMDFIDKNGKNYKQAKYNVYMVWTATRKTEPHTWPGFEDQMYRKMSIYLTPIEIKGLGLFSVRYYNDDAKYDTGFGYVPAFKKILRLSQTTYQESSGGTDFMFSDGMGFNEPMAAWDFKYLGTKYLLHSEFKSPFPYTDEKTFRPVKELQFDVGEKFPRFGWAIFPFHVVEATPKYRHVYGKKILYMFPYPYNKPEGGINMMDIYDRQGKLWKFMCYVNGGFNEEGQYCEHYGDIMWDLQSGHSSNFWFRLDVNPGLEPTDCSMKKLLSLGR